VHLGASGSYEDTLALRVFDEPTPTVRLEPPAMMTTRGEVATRTEMVAAELPTSVPEGDEVSVKVYVSPAWKLGVEDT
jgi:hypothetical protein